MQAKSNRETVQDYSEELEIQPAIIREKQCLIRYGISRYSWFKVRKDPGFPQPLKIPALPGVKAFDIKKTDRYFGITS